MKKLTLAVVLLLASAHAHAVLPQVATVVFHFLGGYMVAAIVDKTTGSTELGIGAATVLGFAKEVSDLNFNGPDFIAWPLGGMFYKWVKDAPGCWVDPEPLWYAEQHQCVR